MLDILLVWVPPETDLETRNQVQVWEVKSNQKGSRAASGRRQGKEPKQVCDQEGHGWKEMEHGPTGEALGTNLKHTHP